MAYQLPDIRLETEKRVSLLVKAKNNPKLQGVEMEMCKRDILYWCKNYVYTDKNSSLFFDEVNIIPMIPFPFQEELITEVWKSIIEGTKPVSERIDFTNIFIEKSRQNGVSWWMVAIFMYGFIFHNHKYLMLSQKEDDVDKAGDMKSLFEKARFIVRNLPTWMLPEGLTKQTGTECNKFKSLSRKDGSGSITGESASPNASRGGTYHAIFLDEFGFMSNATTINTAAASATPCRIWNSTPNGEGNEQFRMRKLTMERRGIDGVTMPPEVKGLRFHWSENPLYDKAWYEWKIKGMTPEKIAQELEISYATSVEGRVYTDFPKNPMLLKYEDGKPIYIFIDNSHGGQDPHAIIVAQLQNHYINVIDHLEINCSVTDMAEFLVCKPKMQLNNLQIEFLERYKNYNWQRATFVSDPYDTHSTLNQSTIFDEYRKVGIYLQIPTERNKKEQIMKARANVYRVRYNEYCLDFASALMNARYPTRTETSNATTSIDKPIHDWTSHSRSALEYGICYILENPVAEKKSIEDTRPRRNMVTGQLVYPT